MSRSGWLCAGGMGGLLVLAAFLCSQTTAADLDVDSDVDLTLREGGDDFTNSVGMKFVRVPPGKFMMGAPKNEVAEARERPQHEVEISKAFYLGAYEVTQKQYETVTGKNPSHFCATGRGKDKVKGIDTSDFPVEEVTWDDAQAFLARLNARPEEKKLKRAYRLPREAEWEYACRAGSATYQTYHFGDRITARDANYDNGVGRTCKVGSYRPNKWGLYDMHGNVWEWVQDWDSGTYYAESPRRDPPGPPNGTSRVHRGGAWNRDAAKCRSSSRSMSSQTVSIPNLGFRVALDAPQ